MKDILRLALVVLLISTSRTEAQSNGNPVKDNRSAPIKKGKSEVESRQFDGNLGETVNNLTKDYIKGATNPTPEEVQYLFIVTLVFDANLSGTARSVLPICK